MVIEKVPTRSIQEEAGHFCLASAAPFGNALNDAGERIAEEWGWVVLALSIVAMPVHGQVALKMGTCCNAIQLCRAALVWWL